MFWLGIGINKQNQNYENQSTDTINTDIMDSK